MWTKLLNLLGSNNKKAFSSKDKLLAGHMCDAALLDAPGVYYRQILLPTRVYFSNNMLFFEEVEIGKEEHSGIFHHSSPIKAVKDISSNVLRFETATSAAFIVNLL